MEHTLCLCSHSELTLKLRIIGNLVELLGHRIGTSPRPESTQENPTEENAEYVHKSSKTKAYLLMLVSSTSHEQRTRV
jgi:hypothetical protein